MDKQAPEDIFLIQTESGNILTTGDDQLFKKASRLGWKKRKYIDADIAESRNRELEEENKKLRSAIECALKIEDLWLFEECKPEHAPEAEALHMMKYTFLEALKQIGN